LGEKRPKIIPISGGFLADLTNSAWRILADFYIISGGFKKNHLATLNTGHLTLNQEFLFKVCQAGRWSGGVGFEDNTITNFM
jgi:hypothetical protein